MVWVFSYAFRTKTINLTYKNIGKHQKRDNNRFVQSFISSSDSLKVKKASLYQNLREVILKVR
jgi:hypothetical protein